MNTDAWAYRALAGGSSQRPPSARRCPIRTPPATDPIDRCRARSASPGCARDPGTWQPDATPMFGHAARRGGPSWSTTTCSPASTPPPGRAADEAFSTNWLMVMARRGLAGGQLRARDAQPRAAHARRQRLPPAAPDRRTWRGEASRPTAPARPLHGGGPRHQREIAGGVVSVYAAPSGEPALGRWPSPPAERGATTRSAPSPPTGSTRRTSPSASSRRASTRHVKVEGSWFNGRRPDGTAGTSRPPQLPDSWSVRVTASPAPGSPAQASLRPPREPRSPRTPTSRSTA